jgi:uncharacterized membrane-anchored protein
MRSLRLHPLFVAAAAIFAATLAVPAAAQEAEATGPQIDWVKGPKTVDLGAGIAEIRVGTDHLFADADETRKLMELHGNPVTDTEVGYITSMAEDESWFTVFEYEKAGFVKDDDKDEIDADAILKGIREGTEASNEMRKKMGHEGLHVNGWYEAPHYDSATHNLVWATDNRTDSGERVINYNIRLLGRRGYMSATVVASPGELAKAKTSTANMLQSFAYKPGNRYAEFISGDKVAEYGLTALIAGGAGAAAAKLGLFGVIGKLLAKAWKFVILGFAALAAGLKKLFAGRGAKVRHGVPDPEPR